MSDSNCANLIDLSLEDDLPCDSNILIKTENANTQPSEATLLECPTPFISPTWRKRDSLDNNPFDCIQKLADRIDDPFDIVEKEACWKAQQALKPKSEVREGNLLSLSDDNLLEEEEMPETAEDFHKLKTLDLDMESPPVLFNERMAPDSISGPETDSNPNSSAESTASANLKKNMEYRKRLLKFSISNAAFSSPIGRKTSLEFEDILGTPVSFMLSKAAEFGEHLLAAESPLKLVEDEDIMSQEPPNFIDSEKNFEKDLEMLKIPILNELPSPAVETMCTNSHAESPDIKIKQESLETNALPNLAAIKAKLKAKKEEINNNHQQEISSLIHNLKSLIASGEMVDNVKKQQASALLESLSSALKPTEEEETLKPQDTLIAPQPPPIKRQGTFDIDLQDNEQVDLDNQPLVKDMPNCMISSSATYDGETAEEKQHLNLPEIAPLSEPSSPTAVHDYQQEHQEVVNENHMQPDVNDIMEQLSKILINNSGDNATNNQNPTFIVVMNTNQLNHSHINNSQQSLVDAKQRSSFVANYLENSINDGSPDLTKVNPITRRRSQSLSIHDKVKIVQLPLQPPTPLSIQKQQRIECDDSSPITTPPTSDRETPEFKTPARMVRRNSYSSGTPYTAQVGVRRTDFGSDGKNYPTSARRPQTLHTHHEGLLQQQAIVRPMPMPSNNLPTFKPDLKKKTKHNTESIIKSSGPLKATIPVKKVAPMLKTSPPTPDSNGKSSFHNTSLQSHSKIGKVPTTPLPGKASTSTLSTAVGYPNACSTPAAFTSPLKRISGPLNKPRYSYMSTTPNPKTTGASSAAATGLKRRTITEFKAKSPLKPRVSSAGLAAAAAAATSSSKTSTGSSRLSTSAGARISKTPIKSNTSNTATVKPTTRFGGSRISVGGSALSARNKENKRP